MGCASSFLVLTKIIEDHNGGKGLQSSFACLSGQRPFQCRYCPYSASQKGNLKTHVLCVHRMPFDNSQYPDRRFKRSRVDSETTGNFEENPTVKPGCSTQLTVESTQSQK
ncbi:hypothetical protein XENTR_v10011684 [Xenopus tropicalis]|nr:hypothetical protein XENTR_v10011684 [Xenopus tropicalis]